MIITIDKWDFEIDVDNKAIYYISPIRNTARRELIPSELDWGYTLSYKQAVDKARKLLAFSLELQQVLA